MKRLAWQFIATFILFAGASSTVAEGAPAATERIEPPPISPSVPLDVHRRVIAEVVPTRGCQPITAAQLAEPDMARRLADLQQRYETQLRPQWLRQTGRLGREAGPVSTYLMFQNPYRYAVKEIAPLLLAQQIRNIGPTNANERAQFVDAFCAVDLEKLVREPMAPRSDEENRVLASVPLLRYFGDKAVSGVIGALIGKTLDKLSADDQKVLLDELKELQRSIKQMKENNDSRLNDIGNDVAADLTISARHLAVSLYAQMQLARLLKLEYETRHKVNDLEGELNDVQQQTKTLSDESRKLNKQVNEIGEMVLRESSVLSETARNVDTLLYEQFLNLSSERKLAWLKDTNRRLALEISEGDLPALKERLSLDVAARAAEKYFVAAKQTFAALSRMGLEVDPAVKDIASRALSSGESLSHMLQAAAKHDVLGVVTSFFGALGGLFGGEDVEGLRYKNIMEKLHRIEVLQKKTYVEVVNSRLDIADLAHTIEDNHVRVMARLHVIETKLDTAIELIAAVHGSELRTLMQQFWREGIYTNDHLTFCELIRKLRDDASFRAAVHSGCVKLTGLGGTVAGTQTPDPIFSFKAKPGEVSAGVLEYWEELCRLAKEGAGWKRLWLLQEPALSVVDDKKRADRAKAKPFAKPWWNEGHFDELLRPERVVGFAEMALRVAPLCYFLSVQGNQVQFVDLANGSAPDKTAAELAEQVYIVAARLVDLTIAQQALLQGDVVVGLLAKRLDDPELRRLVDEMDRLQSELELKTDDVKKLIVAHRDAATADEELVNMEEELNARFEARKLKHQYDAFRAKLKSVEDKLFLKTNPVLAHNLLIYLLRSGDVQRLRDQRLSRKSMPALNASSFAFFVRAADTWYLEDSLRGLLVAPKLIVESDGKRYVAFPDSTIVALPEPSMMDRGNYYQSQGFQRLVRVRSRLAEALAGIWLKKDMQAEENTFLTRILTAEIAPNGLESWSLPFRGAVRLPQESIPEAPKTDFR